MFLTFEGIDGCGKTTQLQKLKTELENRGHTVVCTREPGGTSLAEKLREVLLHSINPIEKRGELLLFGAARAQHVEQIIRPALQKGHWVLCDRFIDSSEAYQGGGLGIDTKFIRQMNSFATNDLLPEYTFLFDLDPKIALQRRAGEKSDRIEARGLTFQTKVREEYCRIGAREKERFVIIDAARTPEIIGTEIIEFLDLIGAFSL